MGVSLSHGMAPVYILLQQDKDKPVTDQHATPLTRRIPRMKETGISQNQNAGTNLLFRGSGHSSRRKDGAR